MESCFGFTGPKAEGMQARHARPFTNHEKINVLKNYIKGKNKKLIFRINRWRDDSAKDLLRDFYHENNDFRIEIRRSVRVFIPPNKKSKSNPDTEFRSIYNRGFNVWICPDSRKNSRLILLEDIQPSFSNNRINIRSSGYSMMFTLMNLEKEMIRRKLGEKTLEYNIELFAHAAKNYRLIPEELGTIIYQNFFSSHAAEFLFRLNAHIAADRMIHTLYCIRARGTQASVGYPIFIAAA